MAGAAVQEQASAWPSSTASVTATEGIWVESEPWRGIDFYFTLPEAIAP
ncbi:MAG: hypothetical protein QMC96_05520 [Methanomicrobiales archaeon]|nr:hypothetical protein [Methanomicrobiales archaeon]